MSKKAKRYFGTDGIRGEVGKHPITADFVLKIGWALGMALAKVERAEGGSDDGRGSILIGKDTRISGYMFESVLESGLAASGKDVMLLGPMPTPAVAWMTRTLRARAGVVISASHNLHSDNGIKFFDADGIKLSDDMECAIEAQVEAEMQTVSSEALGKATRVDDAAGRYIEFCKSTVPVGLRLHGLRIVVDCAHGATYHIAPKVFSELGAEVIPIGCSPDGLNINAGCGVLDLGALRETVRRTRADIGIAFDGDGDRVAMVDSRGEVFDGDRILFILVEDRLARGERIESVVGTVMSGLGLEESLQTRGVRLDRAQVGDRHVMERMRASGSVLGGEPSGHIICLDQACTGDGIVAALQVLRALVDYDRSLAEAGKGMNRYPQAIRNIRTRSPFDPESDDDLQQAIAAARTRLGDEGRALVRASGTEQVVRVMVEGKDRAKTEEIAERLASMIDTERGVQAPSARDG